MPSAGFPGREDAERPNPRYGQSRWLSDPTTAIG